MALLTDLTVAELYQKIKNIDYRLRDYFISWAESKQLLQEQAELIAELRKRGYEP